MSVPDARALIAGSELVYVSDYFSFVGGDDGGRVAFAIDNNRGRDGAEYQAEHLFAVLHDQNRGWVEVAGTGRYANDAKALLPIPDSPAFQFAGAPPAGLEITSASNGMRLTIDPIADRVARHDLDTLFSLGSSAAVLTWKDRVLPGRLIYEYLVRRNHNRITRRVLDGLGELQFFYLLAGGADDLYIQSLETDVPMAAMEKLLGFSVVDGQTAHLEQLRLEVLDHSMALGLYRWPTRWRVSWQGSEGPESLRLALSARRNVGNWFVVGFSMGIVTGELTSGGRKIPVYGLAELLATAPRALLRRLTRA